MVSKLGAVHKLCWALGLGPAPRFLTRRSHVSYLGRGCALTLAAHFRAAFTTPSGYSRSRSGILAWRTTRFSHGIIYCWRNPSTVYVVNAEPRCMCCWLVRPRFNCRGKNMSLQDEKLVAYAASRCQNGVSSIYGKGYIFKREPLNEGRVLNHNAGLRRKRTFARCS